MAKTYKLKTVQEDKFDVDNVEVEVTIPVVDDVIVRSLAEIDAQIADCDSKITFFGDKKTALQADRTAIDTEAKKYSLKVKEE